MPLTELTPNQAYERFQRQRDRMSAVQFFNDPAAGKLRDLWVAAHFGRAYENEFGECRLLFDEEQAHEWDFILVTDGARSPFQVTEAQQSGRKRGREYRDVENGNRPRTTTESWEPGTKHGPEWIREAIERKKNKRYADVGKLNLLVYANFPAYQLDLVRIQSACPP